MTGIGREILMKRHEEFVEDPKNQGIRFHIPTEEDFKAFEETVYLLIFGGAGAGKTTLMTRFLNPQHLTRQQFKLRKRPTNRANKVIVLENGESRNVEFFKPIETSEDILSEHERRNLQDFLRLPYVCSILCYDTSLVEYVDYPFEAIEAWLKLILKTHPEHKFVLLGLQYTQAADTKDAHLKVNAFKEKYHNNIFKDYVTNVLNQVENIEPKGDFVQSILFDCLKLALHKVRRAEETEEDSQGKKCLVQ